MKTSVDVYIFEKPNALVITFAVGSSSYIQVGDEYRSGSRRINEDYSVIVFPSSSNNEEFLKFLASYRSQAFSDILKVIKKNYPENLPEESLKKSLDIDRYQDIFCQAILAEV
ncbi:hypothetical protein LCGC14_2294790 [marine sediment metagenome]|uniref:Uncharacterized protein n=1 Tax=marine sediment metagenome TaxID=412755 RepID=A0A0F9CQN8_9ZZZZ